jgi:hypothetical protein
MGYLPTFLEPRDRKRQIIGGGGFAEPGMNPATMHEPNAGAGR